MKNLPLRLALIFVSTLVFGKSYGQKQADHVAVLQHKNLIWNSAFESRDSVRFYTLFDSAAVLTTAGARLVGLQECKRLCRFLFKHRPDIRWYNEPTQIEVSDDGENAYETGNWTESWTEKNDTAKSEIKGKYWIMYIRRADSEWYIQSCVFTPLSCTGSYCDK